jgi:hypothetical protein
MIMKVTPVMIYKSMISSQIEPRGNHGLHKVTVSHHTADSLDDKPLISDFQGLRESTMIDM